MKTVLVPVEQHDAIESMLETACQLAHLFEGYVEGFWLGSPLSTFVGSDALGAMVAHDADLEHHDEAERNCQHIFENTMQARGLSQHVAEAGGPSYGWTKQQAIGDRFLAAHGRVFDVTVVGQPGSAISSPRVSTFEAALFETGRPILMAPPSSPRSLAENILISWNASVETVRTIAFAMPILTRATKVTILSIPGHGPSEPTADQLARQLQHHGINASVITPGGDNQAFGEVILREATELDCDLLIKGAYTQTRLRQFVFGGATRHIVSEARLPVFMAH
jgi:nucleotide-binding universal stress UspA family protein